MKYTAKVLEVCDNGDVIVELPPELLQDMGWHENDLLELEEKDGLVFIKRVNNE